MSAIEWWRCWHGAPLDPKFLAIADLAGVAPSLVASMAWTLFDHASKARPRGSVVGFDLDGFAAFHKVKRQDCQRVFDAMKALERPLHDGQRLVAWAVRQATKTDNTAKERKQRERARKRATSESSNSREVTPSHAVTSRVTPSHAHREEQQLFSAVDLASAVIPPTTDSVTVRNTVQGAAECRHTQSVEGESQERLAGWFGQLRKRLSGAA